MVTDDSLLHWGKYAGSREVWCGAEVLWRQVRGHFRHHEATCPACKLAYWRWALHGRQADVRRAQEKLAELGAAAPAEGEEEASDE